MKLLSFGLWLTTGAIATTALWDLAMLWPPGRLIVLALALIWVGGWVLDDFWCEWLSVTPVMLRGFLVMAAVSVALGGMTLCLLG